MTVEGDITKLIYKVPVVTSQFEEGKTVQPMESELSSYEWWSFVGRKRIIEYNSKPCHLSCRAYSFVIRGIENERLKELKRVVKDEQACLALREEIKLINTEMPASNVDDELFWVDYLKDLPNQQYTYLPV